MQKWMSSGASTVASGSVVGRLRGVSVADESSGRFRSPIIGDLNLSAPVRADDGSTIEDPSKRVSMLVELNVLYPGGLSAAATPSIRFGASSPHMQAVGTQA